MSTTHREWRDAASSLRTQLAKSPADLDLARKFWAAVSGMAGYDVRSGVRLVETFRICALRTEAGLAALLEAFRELADTTGELPREDLIDPILENRIRTAARSEHPHRDAARWLLECLGTEP